MVEPFGEDRADFRSAIVASTVANAFRDPKKRKPYKPDDFMPKFGREIEPQPWEQQLALVEVLNRAFGGKDLRPQRGNDSDAGDSARS